MTSRHRGRSLVNWGAQRCQPSQRCRWCVAIADGSGKKRARYASVNATNELDAPMRFLVYHLRVHAIHRGELCRNESRCHLLSGDVGSTYIVDKISSRLGHMWKNLTPLLRGDKTDKQNRKSVRSASSLSWIVICVLGECFFDQLTELHIGLREGDQFVRVSYL